MPTFNKKKFTNRHPQHKRRFREKIQERYRGAHRPFQERFPVDENILKLPQKNGKIMVLGSSLKNTSPTLTPKVPCEAGANGRRNQGPTQIP